MLCAIICCDRYSVLYFKEWAFYQFPNLFICVCMFTTLCDVFSLGLCQCVGSMGCI